MVAEENNCNSDAANRLFLTRERVFVVEYGLDSYRQVCMNYSQINSTDKDPLSGLLGTLDSARIIRGHALDQTEFRA